MSGFLSKLFGGNKSEKDVKVITPYVAKINAFLEEYQSLSNDELRSKTEMFRQRIGEHLTDIDNDISTKNAEDEQLDSADIAGRDSIYQEVDAMGKNRDKIIEEILWEILPEAFAVVKETARR